MERLTMTSDKGGLAFTFDLAVTCKRREMDKIVALGERLKAYEDIGTVEDFQRLVAAQNEGRLVEPRICGDCENYSSGRDWDLCCKANSGRICYKDTDATRCGSYRHSEKEGVI